MPSLVTLGALRTSSKQRADMENSGFIGDPEWNAMINKSAQKLYDKLTTVFEDYYQKQVQLTVGAASSVQPCPADFYKLIAMDEVVSGTVSTDATTGLLILNGKGVPVLPYNLQERNSYVTPGSSRTLIMSYVPALAPMVLDADTFDGINGWEEFIIVDAARNAGIKEETDVSELVRDLGDIAKRIEDCAPNRDAGQPIKMVDVRRVDPYFSAYSLSRLKYHLVGPNIRFVESMVLGTRY